MKKIFVNLVTKIFSLTVILAFVAGCSSKKDEPKIETPSNVNLPQWVLQPSIDDGIAAAQCVRFSGNVSLDQQEVTAKGRASLAQQINVRAQVMDKTYQEKVETADKSASGNVFESVSKQLTDQTLVGSKLMRTEFGSVNENQYLCGLVGITPEETEKVFSSIVENPNAPDTNERDKDLLFEEFKAYKAHQELSEALGGEQN